MLTHYSIIPYQVFTIDGLFTKDELFNFQEYINTHTSVRSFTNSNFINGKVIDSKLSSGIYHKLVSYLPKEYTDGLGQQWNFKGATRAVMFAKIEPEQHFGIHTDTGYEYNENNNTYSKFTTLLYLNDDYTGGTTTFYTDTFQKKFQIVPKIGRLLCFDIDLFHSGDVVENGLKYWIGTELICGKINESKVGECEPLKFSIQNLK